MIEVQNVYKSYNGEPVLKGVSLTIKSGEFVSIMGRSGSGKSTLLNVIGGFLLPDEGKVLHDGTDIFALNDTEASKRRCHQLGFVFQSFKLIGTLSVEDNIRLPASLSGRAPGEIDENFARLTEKLGITSLLRKFPDQLSGGQCQRVAIARALCYKPDILILDEPTGALDRANEKTVMELIREENAGSKMTVVMVTHSPDVAGYATRKITLEDGLCHE